MVRLRHLRTSRQFKARRDTGANTAVGMMEENERGRERGLPIDAFEGRLEVLDRRRLVCLGQDEKERVLELVRDIISDGTSGEAIGDTLVAWFTRREMR